jgi:predicted secreted protein
MYEEFVRAKKEVGDKVEKLNLDRFVRKLKKQEEVLKAKHGCKGVRFQVTVKNKQVSLRPRIIR